ncbi:piggyBac transposable element-derived protein 4-like [Astyanax mexicanus]|uniref:piggyBac transposable element-derived protein 4-like n=1 Tax=Astyanax mexicanus TaxID=7994 RepID=UPI0020CB61B0|nr:piggyBac transposable element-derived protein 4-like [Astyanax mexicanus]XP_049324593.1 piggyBac transposable element-derived protein 4-like [Astyanax mexicanus]XP_049339984.1 piggyBac transposable element-derived protein 4-like [Astyanax mexicanus]
MSKRYSVHEVLDHIFGNDGDLEEREGSEAEEDVSEEEDDVQYDPEQDQTSDEEDPDVTDAQGEVFKSKKGDISWLSSPPQTQARAPMENILRMTPGPTRYAVSHAQDIKSTFELFFPRPIQSILLEMTNMEGRRVFGDSWTEMDKTQLDAHMGLLLLAGVYRSCNEATASLWDSESGRPIFRATMSLQAFHVLSRVLRFDNRETRVARRENDKLAPIREVWDKWVENLPFVYNPGPEVTVDERLVPFRGRCPFRQYMPSKPGKYGIKIWAACDAKTAYAWNMQIYTGKSATGVPEKNQGKRVVLDMTKGLRGHNITCDNFFTSYDLAQELLKRKLTMVGTVRKNKPELPLALLGTKDRAPLSSKFAFSERTTVVSYCPKKNKNVILMSTLHRDAGVSSREDKKPDMILDYNKNKGGVDNLDKVTGTYTCKRGTKRWPMVVFYNMLDVSAYNAYVVWTEIDPGWNGEKPFKRRLFLEELGKSLVSPYIERRKRLPRTEASVRLVKGLQPTLTSSSCDTNQGGDSRSSKRKRCQSCPANKDRKSNTTCHTCKKFICAEHTVTIKYCDSCI